MDVFVLAFILMFFNFLAIISNFIEIDIEGLTINTTICLVTSIVSIVAGLLISLNCYYNFLPLITK